MSTRAFPVEAPFDLEGRQLYIGGIVVLGGRWPRVSRLRFVDQRTNEVLDEMPEWVLDQAEQVLVEAARELWGHEEALRGPP